MNITTIHDMAGRFDISETESIRIAETVDTEADFIEVWENACWWTDEAADVLTKGVK